MRKTKIICTLGPSTDKDDVLRQLIREGMNVARFNFSHGSHEEHLTRIQQVRKIAKEENKTVALLMDTKGPEIRTKRFKNSPVTLEEGKTVIIRHDDVVGSPEAFSVTYKDLHLDVKPGSRILIDDGLLELLVQEINLETGDITCLINNGGPVSDHKSVNVPDTNIHLPALTEGDLKDIAFAVENDMDFIAASFIRKADDVVEI